MFHSYNPFVELSRLQNAFFRDQSESQACKKVTFHPVVEAKEEKDAVYLSFELPGVKGEDISIQVENNVLTVSGERKPLHPEKTDNPVRSEFRYGAFSRSFSLPTNIQAEGIEANLDHGVLTLRLAKREVVSGRRIPIRTGAPNTEAVKSPN